MAGNFFGNLLGGTPNAQSGMTNMTNQAYGGCYTGAASMPPLQIQPLLRPQQYIAAALTGLMSREASYLFKYDEMAKEAWDLAEAMAKEAQKRGY